MEILQRLETTKESTLGYYDLSDEDLAKTYGPGKWSVRYILHHLADAETVLYDRIRRVISEPKQVIWSFDESAWAKELDYARVPMELSKRIYASVRDGNIYYAQQYYEQHGQLEFVHSQTGVRTLQEEFEKIAEHNAHHLEQIQKALGT